MVQWSGFHLKGGAGTHRGHQSSFLISHPHPGGIHVPMGMISPAWLNRFAKCSSISRNSSRVAKIGAFVCILILWKSSKNTTNWVHNQDEKEKNEEGSILISTQACQSEGGPWLGRPQWRYVQANPLPSCRSPINPHCPGTHTPPLKPTHVYEYKHSTVNLGFPFSWEVESNNIHYKANAPL